LAGFEKHRPELDALGVRIVAASVDSEDRALEVAKDLRFPVAFGVTREDAERIGAFWDGRRGFVQPSEFLIRADGRILSSTYSSSPIGRVDAADVVSLLKIIEARRHEQEKAGA
jgi:peroxiredoxin